MATEGSSFEAAARAVKTMRLVEVIDEHAGFAGLDPRRDGYAIADMVQRWSPSQWGNVAMCAGTRPPSPTTVEGICELYRARAKRAEERGAA